MLKRKNTLSTVITVVFFTISLALFFSCGKKIEKGKEAKSLSVVKIGVVLPLTGNISSYGQMSLKGMKLAVKKWNDKQQHFDAKLTIEDNLSTTIGAVNAVKKLIEIEKTPIVVGGLASSIALAIVPITEDSKVLFMSAFASSPRLADIGKYFFKVMPSDAFQSMLLANWINELGFMSRFC